MSWPLGVFVVLNHRCWFGDWNQVVGIQVRGTTEPKLPNWPTLTYIWSVFAVGWQSLCLFIYLFVCFCFCFLVSRPSSLPACVNYFYLHKQWLCNVLSLQLLFFLFFIWWILFCIYLSIQVVLSSTLRCARFIYFVKKHLLFHVSLV